MDPANIAHRSGKAPTTTQLVRWEAKGFTVCWTTGGFLDWGGLRYVARDPTYGVLGDLPVFDDGIDNQTTRAAITVLPPSYSALASMASPQHQGTLIQVWEADVDPMTGLLIGTPDLLFRGMVDFPRLINGQRMELVIECGTEEALLNEPNEDRRLSNSFHQAVWPGERGLEYVTGLGRKIFWRTQGGGSSPFSPGGGYVGGGGGGGCAAPETPFLIAPGVTLPSGEVLAGDLAWTRHHLTGEWGFHKVLQVIRLENRERWRVEFMDGRAPYIATPDHLFETGDFAPAAWMRLDTLKRGALISGPRGGVVRSVQFHDHGPVMRFSVEDAQSYVSGGLQNHNKQRIGFE